MLKLGGGHWSMKDDELRSECTSIQQWIEPPLPLQSIPQRFFVEGFCRIFVFSFVEFVEEILNLKT